MVLPITSSYSDVNCGQVMENTLELLYAIMFPPNIPWRAAAIEPQIELV